MTALARIYLLTGLLLVFVGPAAKRLREDHAELAHNAEATPVNRALFAFVASIAIILAWPFLAASAFREQAKRKHLEPSDLFKLMDSHRSARDTGQDQLKNGYGEFGHALTNPIPTRSVLDSITYPSRLRTMQGEKVRFIQQGSM
jgi:hypothetical protein